jgi:hypothetical protein
MINLCAPAIIYLIFSITQILIDTFKGLYNTAFMKVIVTIMVTLLLNILCERNLSVVAWLIVFIPFILMTVIVSMLLYIFGLDVSTGNLTNTCKENKHGCNVDASGNFIIYDPEYNATTNPVFYQSPNIIVRNPLLNDIKVNNVNNVNNKVYYNPIPNGSSGPEYQS